MLDHTQVRDPRDHWRNEEESREHSEQTPSTSRQTISLDALVAERRPSWHASRPEVRHESPGARRFRRRINAAFIAIPLLCLAALGIYKSGLHIMVIWPDGGRPNLHYFWMSNGQEVPSPVARIAELMDAATR